MCILLYIHVCIKIFTQCYIDVSVIFYSKFKIVILENGFSGFSHVIRVHVSIIAGKL